MAHILDDHIKTPYLYVDAWKWGGNCVFTLELEVVNESMENIQMYMVEEAMVNSGERFPLR